MAAYSVMESWNALKLYTVCWNTFTTGMPRTYSVPVLFMLVSAPMYCFMNSMPLPDIMDIRHAMEITTATRHDTPRRQSKANSITSMPTTMTTDPAQSGSMCASSVSVCAAQPSMMRRSSPVACVSKNPSGRRIRCSVVALRMFVAVRNAARCVHISAQKYTMMDAAAKATAAQPYVAMLVAFCQFGATSMRSRATNQMHTNGPKLSSCDMPESAQPR